MNRRSLIQLLIFFLLAVGACTLPFDEESYSYERSVVVDGLVTDQLKNHEILLYYTAPIGTENTPAITDAQVTVTDDAGNTYGFVEETPGHYLAQPAFAGQAGRSYQLKFTTADGRRFESSSVPLIPAPPIDSIYDKYTEQAPEGAIANEGGIQFFLDTHDDTNLARNFRYDWQENFLIVTPLIAQYTYDYATSTILENNDTLHICYAQDVSKSILIANSPGSTVNRIVEFPVRFISQETDVLRNRYALLVRQYAISSDAHAYYRKFKELTESGGSLFDQQQGAIAGNIELLDDPNEIVLGYFEVSGFTEKRAFFSPEDLDPLFPHPDFRFDCGPHTIANVTEDSLPFYSLELRITEYFESIRRVNLAPYPCTDCTGYGTNIKPEFWTE